MSWFPIAKKEYSENVRSLWIIIVAALFLLSILGASAFASISSTGSLHLTRLVRTLPAMEGTVGVFLPILGLMLTFGTLAGERESGSLGLLVAQRVTRLDILLGKALGLWAVLSTALLLGILGASAIIAMKAGTDPTDGARVVVFVLDTLAWAAAWTSIGVLLSAWFKRRATAIGGAVFSWFFFTVIWNVLIAILLFIALGNVTATQNPEDVKLPAWLGATQFLSPNSVYTGLLISSVPGYDDLIGAVARGVNFEFAFAPFATAMIAWIALPFAGAYALFRSRDV